MSEHNVWLIKADPGFSVVLFNGETPEKWSDSTCHRLPVIAWLFDEHGYMKPRTINPIHDKESMFFVIEAPSGLIQAYNLADGSSRTVKDLKAWIEGCKFTAMEVQGSA